MADEASSLIKIGYHDIINNNRSFSDPANRLIDGDFERPLMPGSIYTAYWPAKVVMILDGLYELDYIDLWEVGLGADYIIESGLTMYGMTEDFHIKLDQNVKRRLQLPSKKQVKFIGFTINHTLEDVNRDPVLRNGPTEIQPYGKLISLDEVPPIVERPLRTFPEILGWNQDIFSDLSRHNLPGTHFRVYEYPEKMVSGTSLADTKYAFSHGYVQGIDYDKYFRSRKEAGITIIPTFVGTASPTSLFKPSYDAAGLPFTNFIKAVQAGKSTTDPKSYAEGAEFLFQFALRYGYLATDKSLAKCDPEREKNILVGTGWCNRIEYGNEHDNWFRDVSESYLPEELAAAISAYVDGHCGTLGPGFGALQADPEFEVIMPAMADFSLDYIKSMYYWWIENRPDGKPPKLSYNVHAYFTDGFGQWVWGAKAIHPEAYVRTGWKAKGVSAYYDEVMEWIKRYAPGCPIYHTEVGVDANKYSIVGAKLLTQAEALAAPEPLDNWQTVAHQTLRTLLLGMRTTSIDLITIFTLNDYTNTNDRRERYSDVDGNSDTVGWNTGGYASDIQFNTSGDETGQYANFLAWGDDIDVQNIPVGTRIVLKMHSANDRADYKFLKNFPLRDPKDQAGVGAHLYVTYISETTDTLTVEVSATGPQGVVFKGEGTFNTWRIDAPYGKKTRYYVLRNAYDVLALGKQTLLHDFSNEDYYHLVFSDGNFRTTHAIWLGTNEGAKITRKININNDFCYYKDLENKAGSVEVLNAYQKEITIDISEKVRLYYVNHTKPKANVLGIIEVEGNTVDLKDNGSTAVAPKIVTTYRWDKITGDENVQIIGQNRNHAILKNLIPGQYVYRLTITDSEGLKDVEDVIINVK